MTYVQRLVGRVRETQRDAIPGQPRAALEVLDAIGCILRGADHPMVRRVEAAQRVALACHVDEFDSIHPASATVPAAVVIPAALSVAASRGTPGKLLLEAVLCGYDVLASVATRFGGPELYERGWWPTSTFGALGAAAAAGVLLELDDDSLADALGIASSSVGGLLSEDRFGEGHYLAAAQASAYGVQAAFRAARGMSASWSLLDGPAARAFGTPAEEEPVAGTVDACVFKWYPCARPLHGAIEGLVQLRHDGVDLASLTHVEAVIHPHALRFVNADTDVAGPTEAASSLLFAVCATTQGRETDPAFFREARASWTGRPPSIQLVAGSSGPFSWESRLTCTTAAGERFDVVGKPDESTDIARLRDKFLANTAQRLEPSTASALLDQLIEVGSLQDVESLFGPLLQPCD